MKEQSLRLFIAIDIGEDIRKQMSSLTAELHNIVPGMKPVNPDVMHLTIKFLGSTNEKLILQIIDEMKVSVASISSFTLRIAGAGAFPNPERARVVWVGIHTDGNNALTLIKEELDKRLSGLGFEIEERDFKPHLTLARIKFPQKGDKIQNFVNKYSSTEFGTVNVASINLMQSTLLPSSAKYDCIGEVRLKNKS